MLHVKRVLLLSVVFAAALFLIQSAGLAGEKKLIKVSHSHQADPNSSELQFTAMKFADYISKNSPTLEVKIYAANALGQEREVYEALQLGGGATCVMSGTAILNNFDKRVGVLDLPFVWKSYEHAHKIYESDVGKQIAKGLEAKGLKILGYMDSWGFRNVVTAKKEVKSAADLKGLKIRTIETPIYIAAMKIMDIDATPMSMGEVYTAIQTGVIDGYEHGTAVTVANKYFEVTKFTAETQHLFGPLVVAYSLAEWNKLTPEEQKVVAAAADFACAEARKLSKTKEDEAKKFLISKGMIFHPIDTTEFRKKAVEVQDKLAAERGATDLLKVMRSID